MKSINLSEANTQLSQLVDELARENEIIILKDNQPVAKLIGLRKEKNERVFGQYKGQIKIADDFNQSVSEQFWLGE